MGWVGDGLIGLGEGVDWLCVCVFYGVLILVGCDV